MNPAWLFVIIPASVCFGCVITAILAMKENDMNGTAEERAEMRMYKRWQRLNEKPFYNKK